MNVVFGHLFARFVTWASNSTDFDAATTIAADSHERVLEAWSCAVQLSAVEPTGNSDPDLGLQLDVMGATPPETVGEKSSVIPEPFDDEPDGAGH